MSAFCPKQTGEIVALKVALQRLEDGIPNQVLREIKALQEIEDSQYVSGAGVEGCPALLAHSHSEGLLITVFPYLHPHPSTHCLSCPRSFTQLTSFLTPSLLFTHLFLAYLFIH